MFSIKIQIKIQLFNSHYLNFNQLLIDSRNQQKNCFRTEESLEKNRNEHI